MAFWWLLLHNTGLHRVGDRDGEQHGEPHLHRRHPPLSVRPVHPAAAAGAKICRDAWAQRLSGPEHVAVGPFRRHGCRGRHTRISQRYGAAVRNSDVLPGIAARSRQPSHVGGVPAARFRASRAAIAASRSRRSLARSTTGTSIILPSTVTAPIPSASAVS
jgi:hypothetical protein